MSIFKISLLLIFLILPATVIVSMPAEEFRAVKMTNVDSDVLFTDAAIAEAMDYLASIGINTILTVVWNSNSADGDYTLYPSSVMNEYFGKNIHPLFARRDPLFRVIIEAHRNGMEVLPWFEMGFSTSYSQNGGHIIKKYPDWALKDINGNLVVKNGFDWMSAINPEVREFILSLTMEVADNYDIDGIEYSDRIPAMPVEGGYDAATVNIYKSEHNDASPPADYNDTAWKRWRADQLSAFFQTVRDSIKARSEHLFVSSSPSIYPWSYENYLQDSKTWIENGIADNIIPQLYRYNYNDYLYELNKSLTNFPDHHDVYFTGILVKSGAYVIAPDFLTQSIQANRDRGIHGEAFFFYEGLRAKDNQLGDLLKATFYSEPALVPGRNANIWRPKATIVNEDDEGVIFTGAWQSSDIKGFENGIMIFSGNGPGAVDYHVNIPFSAWFDVFAFISGGPLAAKKAVFTVFSGTDSSISIIDQTDYYRAGWQPVGRVFLEEGSRKVVKLSSDSLLNGEKLTADAVMVMINRRLSPEVFVTSGSRHNVLQPSIPSTLFLEQNYPNPFNNRTLIRYHLPESGEVSLLIFDISGRQVASLIDGRKPVGSHEFSFDGADLASGVYFYQLKAGQQSLTRKLVLIK